MNLAAEKEGVYTLSFFGGKVLAAFSGRQFPKISQFSFLEKISIDPSRFCRVHQVHGREAVIVEKPSAGLEAVDADALITSQKGLGLGILTADCVPVFFWDPGEELIGMAHAGWRGLYQGILEEVAAVFSSQFRCKPEAIQVAFGPAIRKCCYEVGEEFKAYFPETCQEEGKRKESGENHLTMDLILEAKNRLRGAGIIEKNIFDTRICTVCQNSQFFSARKEKTEERILSVIQMRP